MTLGTSRGFPISSRMFLSHLACHDWLLLFAAENTWGLGSSWVLWRLNVLDELNPVYETGHRNAVLLG